MIPQSLEKGLARDRRAQPLDSEILPPRLRGQSNGQNENADQIRN
jgi:hypothetical protein